MGDYVCAPRKSITKHSASPDVTRRTTVNDRLDRSTVTPGISRVSTTSRRLHLHVFHAARFICMPLSVSLLLSPRMCLCMSVCRQSWSLSCWSQLSRRQGIIHVQSEVCIIKSDRKRLMIAEISLCYIRHRDGRKFVITGDVAYSHIPS